MSIFKNWKGKKEKSERSFREIYDEAIDETEKLTNLMLKASGVEFTDVLGFDRESGAAAGEMLEHANKLMGLSAELVSAYDRMEGEIKDLNEHLLSQDRTLQIILGAIQK